VVEYRSCRSLANLQAYNDSQIAFPHFLGLLALATLRVCLSTTAYLRSPTSPSSAIYEELISSPIIDFTGYRHNDTIVHVAAAEDCCWFTSNHHPAS
jgi:hypothetical protein